MEFFPKGQRDDYSDRPTLLLKRLIYRPSHWQRQSKNESFHRRLAGTVETSSQSKMSRMRLLRESIVRPRLAIPDNKKIRDAAQKRKNVSAILQRGNTSNNQQNTPVSDELHRGSIIAEKLRNMSYRPTTMPKPQATETLSNRMDATADAENAFVAPALNRSSFSSPTLPGKNRSSKHHNKGGAWTKRLAILKSNQTNDVMKLQHDGMNRHSISYDLNDPRKRANTYTDVTILSDEDCHGVNIKNWVLNQTVTSPSSGDGTLLTVSSYIHEHAPVKGSARESVGKSFAWISFTRATARNVGLENGMNLRIYNAVLLPVRQGSGKTTIHGSKTESRFLVICTQLCERHPSVVSHVPNLDTAMITEGQTDYDVPTGTR